MNSTPPGHEEISVVRQSSFLIQAVAYPQNRPYSNSLVTEPIRFHVTKMARALLVKMGNRDNGDYREP